MKDRKCLVFGCSMLLAVFGALNCALAEDDPQIGDKALSEVVEQLRSENRGVQMRATKALSAAPTNLHVQIIARVIPVLKSERENDKFVAAQVLGEYGAMSRAAVPDLLPMLKGTQYERNRAAAAKALGQILVDAQPSEEVDKIAEALAAKCDGEWDRYSDVRREAWRAIGMIGPAAKKMIPKLAKALTDTVHPGESRAVRGAAAWACGRMGPLAAEHVDRLITMLNAEGMPEVVTALGLIGPVQDNVVPNILNFMERDEQYGPAWNMVETWQVLQKFGPKAEQVIPFARRCLRNPYFPVRERMAVEALKFLQVAGPKAVEALPEVESAINYPKSFQDAPAPLKLMREEATKTAGILKGIAATAKEKKNRVRGQGELRRDGGPD